jgi:hypothetical protein
MEGQMFFCNRNKDSDTEFYLVNFQEKVYMKIATKNSQFYPLCEHLYCHNWEYAESVYKVLSTCREVFNLYEIDGSESE